MRPIKALQTLDDAVIILRSEMLRLTGLQNDFIINALSAYGADLAKILQDAQDSIQESIQQTSLNPTATINDTLVLIEASSNVDSNDNMMLKSNAYSAYSLHVIVYGESAEEVATSLKAKLLQIDEKVKLDMLGVHISSISNIESMNEFKNEVMWQRRDMDIHFAFRREYTFD